MERKPEHDARLLEIARYSYAEADHLANVSRGTAKRWLSGYAYRGLMGVRVARPPVTSGHETRHGDGVSFLDLVELVAIGGLKDLGFSLRKIRIIVANCQEQLRVSHPLASLAFKTDGRDIFVSRGGRLVDVLRRKGAQAWEEVLDPFLQTLDYQDEFARRWWPLGKDKPILVDPDFGFGLPVIAGSGVRTEIILERFQAGDLPEQIAEDFNLTPVQVERALQFEVTRLAA
jgi:uncharacterized protein (DUF433 family)